MCFNQRDVISTLSGGSLKLVDKSSYIGSRVSSTEDDINTWIARAWTDIDRLSVIWKSDLFDRIKQFFFQNGGRIYTIVLMYHLDAGKAYREKAWGQLLKDATRYVKQILEATSHKISAIRQPIPISRIIIIRRTKHARHCWRRNS